LPFCWRIIKGNKELKSKECPKGMKKYSFLVPAIKGFTSGMEIEECGVFCGLDTATGELESGMARFGSSEI
jgi:hypothetical protein